MTVTTALGVAATTCGVVMGLSPLLQIRTVLARRSSDDVSVGYLLVLCVGFVLWLAYGIALANAALVISNAVALSTYGVTTAIVIRYRTTELESQKV